MPGVVLYFKYVTIDYYILIIKTSTFQELFRLYVSGYGPTALVNVHVN